MNKIIITPILLQVFLGMGCKSRKGSELASNGVPLGEFRGIGILIDDLSKTLGLENQTSFLDELRNQIGEGEIAGSFHQESKRTRYLGGTPNPGNTLLYISVFDKILKEALGKYCETPFAEIYESNKFLPRLSFTYCGRNEFTEAFPRMDVGEISDRFAMIPPGRKAYWREQFGGVFSADKVDKNQIREAILALILDPYFMLEAI